MARAQLHVTLMDRPNSHYPPAPAATTAAAAMGATATAEPAALVRGKAFHRRLQASWAQNHGGIGEAGIEQTLARVVGKRSRVDIRVDIAREDRPSGPVLFVALLEAKSRDFTRLSRASRRRLLSSDRRQIMRYVNAITTAGPDDVGPERIQIAASLIYESGPETDAEREAIEAYFDKVGVAVVWEDETVEEAAARLANRD